VVSMPSDITVPCGLGVRIPEYVQWLADRGCAPATQRKYGLNAGQFVHWLIDNDRPVDPDALTELDVRAYLRASRENGSPATHHARFIALRSFLTFLMKEGFLEGSHDGRGRRVPVVAANLDAPPRPDAPDVPIIHLGDFMAVMGAVTGERPRDFLSFRDEAILWLFWDTGARLAEIANITVEDVSLRPDGGSVWVTGKAAKRRGPQRRLVGFSPVAAAALRRYLEERVRHGANGQAALWLGRGGSSGGVSAFAATGVSQMLYRRVGAVVPGFHPHMFRHSFVHRWLDRGGEEGDLMRIVGWTDRSMLDRYARTLAGERARRKLPQVMGW
jgi:integrase/recombinase XerC